jgi:hypothetical protein
MPHLKHANMKHSAKEVVHVGTQGILKQSAKPMTGAKNVVLTSHSKHAGVGAPISEKLVGRLNARGVSRVPPNKRLEQHMFGVHETVVSNTTAHTRPVTFNSQNLMGLVDNTTGDAMRLVRDGVMTSTRFSHHRDSVEKGTGGIGHVKTQPMRYGQSPYAGPKY